MSETLRTVGVTTLLISAARLAPDDGRVPDWLESVALGLAGGVALALVIYVVRIPGEVRRNDRLLRDRDDDLATWVADTKPALDWRLKRIADKLAAREALRTGELNWSRGKAKEAVLHAYRDQEREANRFAAQIELRETWGHRAWRLVCRRSLPRLTAPARAEPVLDLWGEDATEDGLPSVKVVDPTRTTLEDIVRTIAHERREQAETSGD